jgi:hypothetical protein
MKPRMTTLGFAALITAIAISAAHAQNQECSNPQKLACYPTHDGVLLSEGDGGVEQLTKSQCVTPCGFWSRRRDNTVKATLSWGWGGGTTGTVHGRDFRCGLGSCPVAWGLH